MAATDTASKIRINGPDGKLRWVTPEQAAQILAGPQPTVAREMDNPSAQAVADLSLGQTLDWDGDAIEESAAYDEYLAAMPSREELRPFPTPRRYWEVRYPGCTLQPYPRMGGFQSTETGLWQARNPAQDAAVREHIRLSARTDPDTLRVTDAEWAVMSGQAPGSIRYCQDGLCKFVSCSMIAVNLHEALCGHRTDSRPRKDL